MRRFFIVVFLLISVVGFSQPPKQGRGGFGRLQSLKVAYLTKQLSLTPDEAAKFWPIYYAYTGEIEAIRRESANNVIAGDEKLLNVKKKYWGQFRSILGSDERVNKVFLSEREFGNLIRKEIEARQKMRQQRFQRPAQPVQ